MIARAEQGEVLGDPDWKRWGPIEFDAARSPHAQRRVGDGPALYPVIDRQMPATRAPDPGPGVTGREQ